MRTVALASSNGTASASASGGDSGNSTLASPSSSDLELSLWVVSEGGMLILENIAKRSWLDNNVHVPC